MEPWIIVVLLGIAVMVYAILQPNRSDGRGGVSIGEFEEALDRFADVMEEDNRELLETVGGWRREMEADLHRLAGRVDALEKQAASGGPVRFADEGKSERPTGGEGHAKDQRAAEVANQAGPDAAPAKGPAEEAGVPDAPGPDAAAGRRDAAGAEAAAAGSTGIRARYPALFALHDAGKSVDYIAKKSGMNKGEVLLILQLAKREEQHRA